jgi:hypothetical protein
VSPVGSAIPLLMLCALLKLGVLKPAGASVAEFAATLASPVPKAATAAKRQEHRRTFLQWGMSMRVSSKDSLAYAGVGRKLADLLTLIRQRAWTDRELRLEAKSDNYSNWVSQKLFPAAEKKTERTKGVTPGQRRGATLNRRAGVRSEVGA